MRRKKQNRNPKRITVTFKNGEYFYGIPVFEPLFEAIESIEKIFSSLETLEST
jgi:hypothetical protein